MQSKITIMKNEVGKIMQGSRRKFISNAALAGAGIMLAGPVKAFAGSLGVPYAPAPIQSKGWAARDTSGNLSPYNFQRRALGDNDILIDIKYSGVCHSDIHTVHGDWGPQKYPLVPGHEIAGIVAAVGKNVKNFKVGDQAGVGCMVDSCGVCESCKEGQQQYCDNNATVLTYGSPDKTSPDGYTQGGYANNMVIKESFAIKIPQNIRLQDAAPLLCAGITTYSPLMRAEIKPGMKIGVAGIGGLGHMAVKLAVSKGAEVYAFTTSAGKVNDILGFGAKEVIVVDSSDKLTPHFKKMDFMISTIPAAYDLGAYSCLVKPYGTYVQVGVPAGELSFKPLAFVLNRVNYRASAIGGIPQTQEVMNYCADHKIYPEIQLIKASEINDAYKKVVAKQARYRFVIDAATV